MSSKLFSNLDFSKLYKKVDVGDLASGAKKFDYSSLRKTDTTSALRKTDASSVTRKSGEFDGIKKLESSSYTKKFGDTVKKSNFYKNNQKKILAAGLTVASLAGWYGTLLAQGYSPAEAWDEMQDTFTDVAAKTGETALKGIWLAFVILVHNFAGKHVFDDSTGTEAALKIILPTLVVLRLLSLLGINVFSVLRSILFGGRKAS